MTPDTQKLIRRYFRGNMFDGDEAGLLTSRISHLLDQMVEVVEFMAEDGALILLDRLAVPCETCEGLLRVCRHGVRMREDACAAGPTTRRQCPDCVNGLVPHPDRIELGARAIQSLYNETGATWQEETDKSFYRGAARAVLLADLRHLLDGT